jgi:septal ring factor EnvC (AmiA/AmiB activator)
MRASPQILCLAALHIFIFVSNADCANRLRQTDVKAGHFERKVQALESERDQWESKYEEMSKKYAAVQQELADFQAEIGNMYVLISQSLRGKEKLRVVFLYPSLLSLFTCLSCIILTSIYS